MGWCSWCRWEPIDRVDLEAPSTMLACSHSEGAMLGSPCCFSEMLSTEQVIGPCRPHVQVPAGILNPESTNFLQVSYIYYTCGSGLSTKVLSLRVKPGNVEVTSPVQLPRLSTLHIGAGVSSIFPSLSFLVYNTAIIPGVLRQACIHFRYLNLLLDIFTHGHNA